MKKHLLLIAAAGALLATGFLPLQKKEIFAMSFQDQISARATQLKELATRTGLKLGTAESLTGGLIAGSITAVPGSSGYFYGGIVSYDNSVKQELLGVPQEVLDGVGAVSSACAEAMASGARAALKVDIAVSVTGVAGPDGGTEEIPVGTVWFGLARAEKTTTEVCHFAGTREEVREQTVLHALELLCDAMGGK